MILKTFRLRALYGPQRIKNHVGRGDENEEIVTVQGEDRDLDDLWNDALARGREYAARHVVIASKEEATLEALLDLMRAFCDEFGIDIRKGYIRAHKKPRLLDNGYEWHLHGIFPEWDEATGRVIDSKMSYRRQEYLARCWEHENSQPAVHGKHHRWVVAEMVRRNQREAAQWLMAAFPYDAPRTYASMAESTMQMLKRQGLSGSELKAIVRDHWRAAPPGDEFVMNFLDRMSLSGMLIKPGTGTPPVWVVTTTDGHFLFTLAGAAGVTRENVNVVFGDLKDEDTQRNPDPRARTQADSRRRSYLEASRGDQPKARSDYRTASGETPQWDNEVQRERRGQDIGSEREDTDRRERAAPDDGGIDQLLPESVERGAAARDLVREEAEDFIVQISARRSKIDELLDLAIIAFEAPFDRIQRELREIEQAAQAVVDKAAKLPTPPSQAVADAKVAIAKANEDLNEAATTFKAIRAAFDDAEAAIAQTPFWRKKPDNPVTGYLEAMIAHDKMKEAISSANLQLQNAVKASENAETARQDRAVACTIQLDLTYKVRHMLAIRPLMARYNTFTLLMFAMNPDCPDFRDIKDLWGIPIRPRPPKDPTPKWW